MQSRDDRGTQPFGKRRPLDWAGGPAAPAATSEIASPDALGRGRALGPLAWALRVSGFVGLLAVVAVTQLARLSESDGAPTRVALAVRPVPGDPETTGAIPSAVARSAQAIRLDPCLVPVAAHPRP